MRERARLSVTSRFPRATDVPNARIRRLLGNNTRRLGALGLVALSLALSTGGCSRQGEGERCDKTANADNDCEDGLICTPKVGADRCCPPDGAPIDDSRCSAANAPSGGITGGTDSGGSSTGGSTAGSTSGGLNAGGTTTGGASTGGDTASSGAAGVIETPTAGAGGEATGGESGAADEAAGTAGQSSGET